MRQRIGENLYFIPGRRGGRFPYCNSLYIASGGGMVVDPASDAKELQALAAAGVAAVLLSHYHTDHLREARLFAGAQFYAHRADVPALASFEVMVQYVWGDHAESSPSWSVRKLREVGEWGWTVHRTLEDGEELTLGAVRLQAVHLPGHTPGHLGLWFPDEKILFVSDNDLTAFGPWYGNSASSIPDTLASIAKLKNFAPRLTVTGHEAGLIEGDLSARLEAYARIIHEREARVLEFLAEPLDIEALVRKGPVYGPHYSPDNINHWMEWRMVWHHLRWLQEKGAITVEGGIFRRR